MKIKKLICILLAVMFILPLSSCGEGFYETSFTGVFDTYVQIYASAESERYFMQTAKEAFSLMEEYHKLYDIYNDYDGINNLKTVNDNAGKEPVKVDSRIIDLLKFCKDAYYLTDGNVNVAMGSVLKLWHDARESVQTNVYAPIPDMASLRAASEHIDIEDIIIDEENSTVFISDPHLRIDVGAVAKGYTTQKIYEFFISKGLIRGFVSIGGNVKVLGEKTGNDPGWKIGIQNPDVTYSTPLCLVSVRSGSLVTSGDYQRYFVSGGVKYHHIIDKDTLMPSVGMRSVTVWVDDSALADALSTYFFTISYEDALEFISEHPEYNINAYWVTENNEIKYTQGMKGYIEE
ncbi:MAG: FAD:protein FMN transferase [Eubacteriaceae bacterium]|nr:FAD:protein FMN transferase [Eubacteriaceae bacterium]